MEYKGLLDHIVEKVRASDWILLIRSCLFYKVKARWQAVSNLIEGK